MEGCPLQSILAQDSLSNRSEFAKNGEISDARNAGSKPGTPITQLYFKKPEASEELWAGGYLHTQDVAVVMPDGYIQIVDRIKDVIKTGGEWVSSIEVEGLIVEVPGVQESAVVGVKDEKWGERPMAFVVRKADAVVSAEDIRAYLLQHVATNRISKFAVPEAARIEFVAEIPKTSVGKINKKKLREGIA